MGIQTIQNSKEFPGQIPLSNVYISIYKHTMVNLHHLEDTSLGLYSKTFPGRFNWGMRGSLAFSVGSMEVEPYTEYMTEK